VTHIKPPALPRGPESASVPRRRRRRRRHPGDSLRPVDVRVQPIHQGGSWVTHRASHPPRRALLPTVGSAGRWRWRESI